MIWGLLASRPIFRIWYGFKISPVGALNSSSQYSFESSSAMAFADNCTRGAVFDNDEVVKAVAVDSRKSSTKVLTLMLIRVLKLKTLLEGMRLYDESWISQTVRVMSKE